MAEVETKKQTQVKSKVEKVFYRIGGMNININYIETYIEEENCLRIKLVDGLRFTVIKTDDNYEVLIKALKERTKEYNKEE